MLRIKKRYLFLVPLIIVSTIFCIFFLNVPDLSVEKITDVSETLTLYDKDNNISAVLNGGQMRKSVSLSNIPSHVINALISTEDIRFYEHNGIDIKRIFGALFNDIKAGTLKEGASTITQQLIKNSHLKNEKTFTRKINEAILALQLESQYSKDEILEMYFNYVYFGRGAYGIQAASEAYFGIDVKELSVSQGATLIGVLKAPSKYAPHINMDNAILRRNTVLAQMKKYGYINDEEYSAYKSESIEIIESIQRPDYGYYTDYVLTEGAKCLGISVEDLLAGGYNIYTSLDSSMQEELQKIYDSNEFFPDEKVQSAAVVIDNLTGSISAMIGGRTHEGMRLFNRATSKRQPGSTIKPILVFAPAFENHSVTTLTLLDDYRKDFSGYKPTNYKDIYYGKVTVRKALSLSLNIPAVEVLQKNGIEYSKKFAEKAGITFDSDDKYLALALGGMKYGVSPLELAGAYSVFACAGQYAKPYCINKITDNVGNVIYCHNAVREKVFTKETSFLITDILCDVSKQENNGHNFLNSPIATKTGTVGYNELGHSDAWSAGYTKSHTVTVWMGYDTTTKEQYLPYSVTGSAEPSKISAHIFQFIFDKYGYEKFDKPDSVKKVKIDGNSHEKDGGIYLATDIQSNVIYDYFHKENCPTEINEYWNKPQLPDNITVQLNEVRTARISFNCKNDYTQYAIIRKNSFGENVIAKLKGNKNQKVSFDDDEYFLGDSYIIQPIHREILIDGKPYIGKKSNEYTIE